MSLRTEEYRISRRWPGILLAAVTIATVACTGKPAEAVITIHPEQRSQTISGWEATAQIGEHYSAAIDEYRDSLLDSAVNDLGINRLRLEIRSGVENPVDYFGQWQNGQISEKEFAARRYEIVNDDADPFTINPAGFQFSELDSTIGSIVLPMRELLAKRGERLFLNLNYVDMGSSAFEHKQRPEEYAEFILAAYRHMDAKFGFVPDAVEVVLEPDGDASSWSAEEMARVMVAAGRRLRDENFEPAFIAPSTTSAANAPLYIDEIARYPEALSYISEFSYHRYRGVSKEVLEAISDRALRHGKQTAMLEWIGADHNTLHEDLKTARNSAWQQYVLAGLTNWGGDNGGAYFIVDDGDVEDPVISMGSRTRLLRQYFRYIRAGAESVGTETTDERLDPLAFRNRNGSYVLVVRAEVPGKMTVNGLPPGRYEVTYATKSENNAGGYQMLVGPGDNPQVQISEAGVMTIFGEADGSDQVSTRSADEPAYECLCVQTI